MPNLDRFAHDWRYRHKGFWRGDVWVEYHELEQDLPFTDDWCIGCLKDECECEEE